MNNVNRILKNVLLAAALMAPALSLAGNEKGNGGWVQVCTDPVSGAKSLEMFDLFRARKTGKAVPQTTETVKVLWERAMERMALRKEKQTSLLTLALQARSPQLSPAGVPLASTDDALEEYEISLKTPDSNCSFEQLANFTPAGSLIVREDLRDLMKDSLNTTAFYLHESIYRLAKFGPSGARNSIQVQELVALLLQPTADSAEIARLTKLLLGENALVSSLGRCNGGQLHLPAIPVKANGTDSEVLIDLTNTWKGFAAGWSDDSRFDYKVSIRFANGTTADVDMGPLLNREKDSVRLPLTGKNLAGSTITVKISSNWKKNPPAFRVALREGDDVLETVTTADIDGAKGCRYPWLSVNFEVR